MTRFAVVQTSLAPNSEAALAHYLEVVGRLMEQAGATLVARYAFTEVAPGGYQFLTLVSYPDADAVAAVFDHPDYLALGETIQAAFARYDVRFAMAD